MLLLHNTLAFFDKYNIHFQTSKTATIHKLSLESEHLLRTVYSFLLSKHHCSKIVLT